MTTVNVCTRTHSITYVTDNILKSLKDIIRLSGMDPGKFAEDWDLYQRGIKTWLESEHLEQVILEVYHPVTNGLIIRWDIAIQYQWTSGDDGVFWTDTEQLRYAIQKAGVAPGHAAYRLVVTNKQGRQDVIGWSSTTLRSTDGMVRQSLGSTVQHHGLGGNTSYWRKTG